jgi:hypothetical protein
MSNENEVERHDRMLRGPTDLTGALNTAEYIAQFTIQPGGKYTDRGFDTQSVWYSDNGGAVSSLKPDATLAELSTDASQADSTVAIESPTLVYRPGTELSASAGVFVDVMPTGDATYEVLYGREPRTIADPYTGELVAVGTEYGGFRMVADASTDRDVDLEFVVGSDRDGDGDPTEVVVPVTAGEWGSEDFVGTFDESDAGGPRGRAYGIDPLDGDGRSNIDFDPSDGYVFGIDVGWYAPTAMVPYVVKTTDVGGDWKQRRHPLLIFDPADGPTIQRPNQPIRVVADNGSSGQALSARLGGRAGAYRGDVDVQTRPDAHTVTGQTIAATGGVTGTEGLGWYVVAVVKPAATDPDAIISPETPTFSGDNQAVAMVRIVDESSISGTIEYDEPSNMARQDVAFAIDAKSDTPDRLSLGTSTIDGEAKFDGVKTGEGLIASGGGGIGSEALTTPDNVFGFPIPRDNVFVVMAAARTTSDVALDTSIRVITSG